MYVIYRWNLNKKEDLPYPFMVLIASFLAWANVVAIACFLRLGEFIFDGSRWFYILKNGCLFIFLALLLSSVGSRKHLCRIRQERKDLSKFENYLMVYIGISMLAIIVGILIHP